MWYLLICSLFVLSAARYLDDNGVISDTPELDSGPVLTIKQGTIVGVVAESGNSYEFHGIPYADSTSGTHRFKAPRPPPTFDDTFIANRKNIKCVRALGAGYEGTEDCLVANVFTPTLNETAHLPVMVWIKGREFDETELPELSFKHFVEKDVIVVSLNYRESILGFLCLGTENAPGNAGLKDIVAGLRWVQDNIEHFGGDPNSVTLLGHGSGAAAVDLVTLSPMSNGLIHKAIAQSGTAVAPWAVTRDNLEYAIQVAEALGHTVTNVEDLSNAFTRTSVAALMAVINDLDLTDNSLAFAPCIEREDLQGEEPFLIKSPYQTIVDGDFAQIPFMTGYVDVEGTIRATEAVKKDWIERMETSFEDFLQPDLEFKNDEDRAEIAEAIKRFYFGNQRVTIDEYLAYHGDTMMIVSAIREAQLRATVSNSSVYLYQFSYKGILGDSFVQVPVDLLKAAHNEELAYLFYDAVGQTVPELDLSVSDILLERWTNFAKTGEPTSESSHVIWRPFTFLDRSYLRILDDDEVLEGTLEVDLQDPNNDTVNFWNQIYEEHFLDAKGSWDLTEREVDDEEVITEEPNGDDSGDDSDGIAVDDGDDVDVAEPNSASTAIGYTLLLISLFGILNQFHCLQILSL